MDETSEQGQMDPFMTLPGVMETVKGEGGVGRRPDRAEAGGGPLVFVVL